jgi:hypothetical protein
MKIAVARVKYGYFLKLAIEIYGFFAKVGQTIYFGLKIYGFFE